MDRAKISMKNQVEIPEKVREKLQLEPGDELDFWENEQGEIVLRKAEPLERVLSLLDEVNEEADRVGVTEEELLIELSNVRKERSHGEG